VVVAAVVLVAVHLGSGNNTQTVTAGSSPRPVAAPPGGQWVSVHGLEVTVPASWKLEDTQCGMPVASTVVVLDGGLVPDCFVQVKNRGRLTVVQIGGYGYQRTTVRALPLHPSSIDGTHALIGAVTSSYDPPGTLVYVPKVDAVVEVTGPDPALRRQILDSVRVVRTDSVGCPTRVAAVHAAGSPLTSGAGRLVPGTPVAATVCNYRQDWVDTSRALGPAETARLARVLDALPHRAVTVSQRCVLPYNGSVVHFAYREAPGVDVTVQPGDCPSFAASNGLLTIAFRGRFGVGVVPWAAFDGLLRLER
jgi:hypothetical protein